MNLDELLNEHQKLTLIDKIKEIPLKIKSFFIGLKNFWYYRKLIYNDRWWDYYFLINFIIFKLKNMEENWDKSQYVGYCFTKKRIKVIRRAFENLDNEIEKLEELLTNKKINLKEFKERKKILLDKSFGRLSRNFERFWD